jgi:hypothetical protein
MKRNRIFLLVLVSIKFTYAIADEGMWMLPLLDKLCMPKMKEMGCELSSEDIYNINQSSLKDAVVIFDGGCTGEIVSGQGLLFTNHHCGYDWVQYHSTVENNYLHDGFWAAGLKDELPNPGCKVYFLERIEDVTDSVLLKLDNSLNDADRKSAINNKIDAIEKVAADSNSFEAQVKSYFEGNKYYLCVYRVYKDIRLVGAPPSSIGKFGYDTDNWTWPRFTGDFSVFRIYTAPDGSPAEYAPDNLPLQPKKIIPISLEGVHNGDFSFILGFPGVTDRYSTSFNIKETIEVYNAVRIKVRDVRQKLLMESMNSDPKIQIQYSGKYFKSSNYWKYSVGQNRELRKSDLLNRKRGEENDFVNWAKADSSRFSIYGMVMNRLENNYLELTPVRYNLQFINEALFLSSEIIDFASDFYYLSALLSRPENRENDIQQEITDLKDKTEKFFKDYDANTDKNIVKAMLKLYASEIPFEKRPDFYTIINKKYKGNIDKFVDKLFDKSIFADQSKVLNFLTKPNSKVLSKDIGFKVAGSVLLKYFEFYNKYNQYDAQIDNLNRLYIKGSMEKDAGKFLYPDANFSMRLTYGTVCDYSPADAIHYNYFTTMKGIMEKEDTTNFEFVVPENLKKLYNNSDFGIYGENDTMRVCFITDNDITGGNSGSPVLNSKGELTGIAFDGNWESMSGDFSYEPQTQRCICVDIRYVLFIIDKFAGADRIINELKLVH